MSSVALIVNPDAEQNRMLSQFLTLRLEQECVVVDTEVQALEWLKNNARRVDIVFLSSEVTSQDRRFLDDLRAFDHSRFSTVVLLVSEGDSERIQSLSLASDLIDSMVIKPFRIGELIQKVQKAIKMSRIKNPAVLIAEKESEDRDLLREALGMVGFASVFEVSDGIDAMNLLQERSSEIGVIVTGWELGGISGLQLLKRLRANPKLAMTPFVMVATQTSIESAKNLHAADVGIQSYLVTPFDPKTFGPRMEEVLQKIEKQNKVGKYLRETKVFEARGVTGHAIDLLIHAVKTLPDTAAIYEALGDVYRVAFQTTGDQQVLQNAADAFEKALRLEPQRTRLVTKCVEVYTDLLRPKDTVRVLKSYLYRYGFDDEMRTRLGKLYLQSGDYGAACVELRRALSVNPDNLEAQTLSQIAKDLELSRTKLSA